MDTTGRLTTIEISKEDIKFSAAHFTVFSASERERLHGHNYFVAIAFTAPVGPNGLCFSYKEVKNRLRSLCDSLDEYMLLPQYSPWLQIREEASSWVVTFNNDTMYFLKQDTLLLPVSNITLEELSRYLLEAFLADQAFVRDSGLQQVTLRVSSGAGQWGACHWAA